MIDVFLEGDLDEAQLRSHGVLIGSRLPNGVWTAKIPLDSFQEIIRLPTLKRITAAHRLRTYSDISVPDTRATPDYWTSIPPDFSGNAGAGVIVGIIDTGIDWTHGDFENPDGTTRILNIWDQNVPGTPPTGWGYGTEWTASQIDAGTCTHVDVAAHGTHVTGIVAGDGSATGNGQPADQFIGMAPRADLIVVASDFSSTGVADGVDYVFQRAAALGRPAVVNVSLGSQYGAHRGNEYLDTGLDALTGPGKLIVASVGNEGGQSLHAEEFVPPGGSQAVTFSIPSFTANPGTANDWIAIDAYYTGSADIEVTLTSPGPSPITVGPISQRSTGGNAGSPAGNIYVENGFFPTPSGLNLVYIQIWDSSENTPPRSGTWTITLTPVSTTPTTECDLWFGGFILGSDGVQPLFTSDVEEAELVGSPAAATNIIAVGAYTTRQTWPSIDGNNYSFPGSTPVGALAWFSSPGPRSDGAQKPDMTAPGTAIVSSLSADATGIPVEATNPDSVHWTRQGTSMSAPHVAGGLALCLADNPDMTPSDALSKLAGDAVVDSDTGPVPNDLWGYGKLRMVRSSTSVPAELTRFPRPVVQQNRPNPLNGSTRIGFGLPERQRVSIRVYSLQGRLARTLADREFQPGYNEVGWDGTLATGAPAANGVYFYRFESGNVVTTRRMIVTR